jgi:hypothetical protein
MALNEWDKTTKLIEACQKVLSREWPVTIRQLFYRMIGMEGITNDSKSYKLISRVITKARRDQRCAREWICDRTRPTYEPNVWSNPRDYAEAVKRGYRRDYWQSQPYHLEIWSEKDTITGSIEDLANELGLTVRVARGFNSETRVYEIAKILADTGKRNVVLFLGDHDASGRDIERDWKKRLLQNGSGPFNLRRLAIHPEDIKKFDLPPQRVKFTDSRALKFIDKYGQQCVELDALPPTELRRRIRESVEGLLDRRAWDRAIEVEKVELQNIIETVGAWPTLNTAAGT